MLRTATIAALAAALATPVLAQENPSTGGWTFGVGAATDNRSKDASKSDGDPYAWALAEWTSADGLFYVSPGVETIKAGGSRLETDLTAGIRPQAAGFDLDLSATYKWRAGADAGYDDDYWEFTANVSRAIGPAEARLQLQHSPDGGGSTEAWTWVEARVGWDFTDKLGGTVALGRREQDNAPDYTGWNAGVTYAFTNNLELDVRYHSTNVDDLGRQYDDAVVAGISVYF